MFKKSISGLLTLAMVLSCLMAITALPVAADSSLLEPNTAGGALRYECEDGVLVGANFYSERSTFPTYGGRGFLLLGSGSITMNINVPTAGDYYLYIVSSSDRAEESRCDWVSVNGGGAMLCSTDKYDGSWKHRQPGAEDYWDGKIKTRPTGSGYAFSAGANTVVISTNWGYSYYDSIILVPVSMPQLPEMTGGAYRYECENAFVDFFSGANIISSYNQFSQFSGNGYVEFQGNSFTMNIDVPAAGKYRLYVVSGSNSNENNKCDKISINAGSPYFIYTPAFDGNWKFAQPGIEAYPNDVFTPEPPVEGFDFNAGSNTVTIISHWGWCMYDSIILVPVVSEPQIDNGMYKYECENAYFDNFTGVWPMNNLSKFSDYSGFGYAYLWDGSFTLNINVPAEGNYRVYVAGSGNDEYARCDNFSINDGDSYLISSAAYNGQFSLNQPGTENWDGSTLRPVPLADGFYFAQGENSVKISMNWGYCNYDYIMLVPTDIIYSDSKIINNTENIIAGVTTGTSLNALKTSLSFSSAGSLTAYSGGTQMSEDDLLGTGMIIEYTVGGVTRSYTLSVKLDLNGDGAVGVTDLIRMKKCVANELTLEGVYLQAAVTGDATAPDASDLVRIRRAILEIA